MCVCVCVCVCVCFCLSVCLQERPCQWKAILFKKQEKKRKFIAIRFYFYSRHESFTDFILIQIQKFDQNWMMNFNSSYLQKNCKANRISSEILQKNRRKYFSSGDLGSIKLTPWGMVILLKFCWCVHIVSFFSQKVLVHFIWTFLVESCYSCRVDEQFVHAQVENVKISAKRAQPRC